MGKKTTHYPEVEITDDIHLSAKIILPAFRWRDRIVSKDLEFFDNTDLTQTQKTKKNIQICTGYLYYELKLPFIPFVTMILNHSRQGLNQYTAHFYHILIILDDINNIVIFGPLLAGNLLALYYVKPSRARYILYKCPTKNVSAFF